LTLPWKWAGAIALAMLASGCISDEGGSEDGPGPDAGAADPDGATAPDAGAGDAALPPDAAVQPDAAPPPPACDDEDDAAPNQSPAAAKPVEPGFTRDDLYLCGGAQDWFRVTLSAGQGVNVALAADPPETDLDLALTDLEGNPLVESAGEEGVERVDFVAPEGGDFLVRVSGYGDEEATYALTISSGCRTDDNCPAGSACDVIEGVCSPFARAACGRDDQEPNDLTNEAKPIAPGAAIEATICAPDRDWYAFEVEAGASIDILAGSDAGSDVDFVVVDAATGRLVGGAANDARFNPERATVSFLPAGRYLIGVTLAAEDEADVGYRLEIAGRSGRCALDRECDDASPVCDVTTGTCAPVEGVSPIGGRCSSGEDCGPDAEGCFVGGAGGHDNYCTVQCEDDAGCAAVGQNLVCVRSRGASYCAPTCDSDDDCGMTQRCDENRCRRREFCESSDDCAEGEVCVAGGFAAICSLPPPPPQCGQQEGRGEPNQTAAQATPIALGESLPGLRICDPDMDWYRVTVPAEAAAQVLQVRVDFRRGVDIDVYLQDENGNDVGVAASADRNQEVIEARFIAPGDYLIAVDQYSSDSLQDTIYILSTAVEPNDERCTVAGGECNGTAPLRIVCDEAIGACRPLEGAGQVALGALCDSNDDCAEGAEACWTFEGGERGRNICTRTCQSNRDCANVPNTTCQVFEQAQVAVCLP
jgi:hypothetical protein